MDEIQIIETSIEEAYKVSLLIPEFEPWYPWEKWLDRCSDKNVIALIARSTNDYAGFKVGYDEPGYFYSWVGGVLPQFRRQGIAERLADEQERIVRQAGYKEIRMKTQTRFKAMLVFALGRGFRIINIEEEGAPANRKITLVKNV